jgi:hypothetical protein
MHRIAPRHSYMQSDFSRDGKSFFYELASRREITIYRQAWKEGKTIGPKAVYICADQAVTSLFACDDAADHTFRLADNAELTQRQGQAYIQRSQSPRFREESLHLGMRAAVDQVL